MKKTILVMTVLMSTSSVNAAQLCGKVSKVYANSQTVSITINGEEKILLGAAPATIATLAKIHNLDACIENGFVSLKD